MADKESITVWIERARLGDCAASEKLWESVYEEVRALAKHAVSKEFMPVSVQATEIAHEVYLRLAGGQPITFESRSHLLATVARAIRRMLVDRARARYAEKRGGAGVQMPLDDVLASVSSDDLAGMSSDAAELIDLDEALAALERHDPRQSQLIELRFFGGLTLDEAADSLGLSRRTVASDWALARAWLRRKLGESE